MKERALTFVKVLSQDRYLAVLLTVFLLECLILLGFLAISIKPSELQVVVHYTSFGDTNFYRDRWYYLLSFDFFVVITATLHTFIMYKLLQLKNREFAIAFVWASIVIVLIAGALFYQVLKIASLS